MRLIVCFAAVLTETVGVFSQKYLKFLPNFFPNSDPLIPLVAALVKKFLSTRKKTFICAIPHSDSLFDIEYHSKYFPGQLLSRSWYVIVLATLRLFAKTEDERNNNIASNLYNLYTRESIH